MLERMCDPTSAHQHRVDRKKTSLRRKVVMLRVNKNHFQQGFLKVQLACDTSRQSSRNTPNIVCKKHEVIHMDLQALYAHAHIPRNSAWLCAARRRQVPSRMFHAGVLFTVQFARCVYCAYCFPHMNGVRSICPSSNSGKPIMPEKLPLMRATNVAAAP